MAFTVLYLVVIVLVPLLTLPIKSFSDGWDFFWTTVRDPRVIASYRLTIGASFVAACVNGVLGIVVAWVLVRYDFPGRRVVDAMIDLPFALPTAVAGITLTSLYAPNGWFGQYLEPVRHPGRIQPARHHHRAHLHRVAVRRPHASAGNRGSRCRARRSGDQPRREPSRRSSSA